MHGTTTWVPFGVPTSALSEAITGLSPNINYDFQVIASNSFGSTVSAVVSASTATASGQPPAGSVAGSQTGGTTAPIITGPTLGTAITASTLPIVGVTITDNNVAILFGSSATLTDGLGNTWTINAANNGEAFRNGSAPAFSSNVAQLVNVSGVIYQQNTSNQWYFWNTANSTWTATSNPLTAAAYTLTVTTTAGTLTMPGGAARSITAPTSAVLTDGNSVAWGITSAGALTKAGVVVLSPGVPVVLTPTSGGSVTDSNGHVWTLNSAGVMFEDTNQVAGSSGTGAVTVFNGVMYAQDRATGNWFNWTGTAFISASTPPTTAPAIIKAAYVGGLIWVENASINWYSTPIAGAVTWSAPTTTAPNITSGVTGNGTATASLTDTLANTLAAAAGIILAAPSAAITANVKISFFDVLSNTASITVPVTVMAPAAPSPPTGLTAGLFTTTSATLNFVASTTGTPPITYQPQYRLHGGTTWTSFGSPTSGFTVVISGLSSGATYDFQILAINQAGSVPSAPATGTTLIVSGTPPSVPASVIVLP